MSQNRCDDGARPGQRSGGAGHESRVTFGPLALLAGTGVTHIVLASVAGVTFGWSMPSSTLSFVALAAIIGLPLAVVGCVLALVLGLALRPVTNQILHVTAFFGAFALPSALITLLAGGGPMGALVMGSVIVSATAVGRASVWKLVTVHPENTGTSARPSE